MDAQSLEPLFLDIPPVSDAESRANHELIASLHNNSALVRLVKIRQVALILETIVAVGERDFERAYGFCKSLDAWTDLQESIKQSERELEAIVKGERGELEDGRKDKVIRY